MSRKETAEEERLRQVREGKTAWKKWGSYLSERAWGTVREDYSADGSAWDYFPHDHARSRVYRWNEDGLAGICEDNQFLCFVVALWNERDPILKERQFGLTGNEGNHGEDVKEYYFHLDNTPTHSYMKCLYKYPQAEFPYQRLIEENARRTRQDPEFELLDTGVFDEDRYFDVVVEYSKADASDILISISVTNHGPETAAIDVLPTLWFRNTWAWGYSPYKPHLSTQNDSAHGLKVIEAKHRTLGTHWLLCESDTLEPQLLFTENETNNERLFGCANKTPFVKDGINNYVVNGDKSAVNPNLEGTKCAAHYHLEIEAGQTSTLRLRLTNEMPQSDALGASWQRIFDTRREETDEFYATLAPSTLSDDARLVQRQAFAGLLWSKQFYNYDVRKWLMGDPTQPLPPQERWQGRNHEWAHMNNRDILSMPDTWEYPWYAAWDLAFHTIPFALIDAEFAKEQLIVLLREWYMHPNGQLPAYEWGLHDVNPPVHAWAALRVYRIEKRSCGEGDMKFLERIFHKLLINFTWWVNRKDAEGRNIFQGGFLGLDNIGVFDRNAELPGGTRLDQSDGTSWMAMYCLNMLAIALELARCDDTYEDVATKFLEHFFYIAHAMNDRPATCGDDGVDLWDNEDGFYYDLLRFENGEHMFLRLRSLVGLIPMLAVETLDSELLEKLPGFRGRLEWFIKNRADLCRDVASISEEGSEHRRLFAVVNEKRLERVLKRVLDTEEFLSPYGLRSLSRHYLEHPYHLVLGDESYHAAYEPAESQTTLFGGNSNWRGPIWFPLNYLIIEALQKFDHYYGDEFQIECPTGSGQMMSLWDVATELSHRLNSLFLRDQNGQRPVFGDNAKFQNDPRWRDYILFYEYFHGDNGTGLGASHQTGWTALVAKLIQQSGN